MSGAMLPDAQVQRAARRIFRKLRTDGAFLAPAKEGAFGLFLSATAKQAGLLLDASLVQAFLARDWLTPARGVPQALVLSAAGEAWYRRAGAAGDPFIVQHQQRRRAAIRTGEGVEQVVINDAESPLAWLKRRRRIDPSQYEAGERLRRDYTLANLSPRMAVDLTQPLLSGRRAADPQTFTETVLAARQRFTHAMRAVGPGLGDVLFDVCCHLVGLEEIEHMRAWPRRSARVVLDIALDRLAVHYGLHVTGPSRAPMRAWQAPEEEA